MGNKAVLNITKFSLGDCSSMASLLLPTCDANQDFEKYDATELTLSQILGNNPDDPPTDISRLLLRWADELSCEPGDISMYYYNWFDYNRFSSKVVALTNLLTDLVEWNDCEDPDEKEALRRPLVLRIRELLDPEYSGSLYDSIDWAIDLANDSLSRTERTKQQFDDAIKTMEASCPSFFHVIRYVAEDKLSFDEQKQIQLQQAFDDFQYEVNMFRLKKYIEKSVDYPYFLDLGFDKTTQTNELDDTHGDTMHCVQREGEHVDPSEAEDIWAGWKYNYEKGDKLRIRDMFRIDKLNKVSPYESLALVPGHYGFVLDEDMEQEDVVSRLMQNDIDCAGVLGTANVGAGLYILTASDDASGATVRGTVFADKSETVHTDTFRSFVNPSAKKENYFTSFRMHTPINLMRRFGDNTDRYSCGNDFLSWYKDYCNAVVVDGGQVKGGESALEIVGTRSYKWYPSTGGVKYLLGIYDKEEFDDSQFKTTSYRLPDSGLSLKAGMADDNYKANVPRSFSITIPCNPTEQFSYLTFECGMIVHQDMNTINQEASIEFALDDSAPIRFYILSGDKQPENIDESHPLYQSFKWFDPTLPTSKRRFIEPVNNYTKFQLIIENDLLGELPKVLHVSITATFPALSDIISSDETLKAYNGTYVEVRDPQILFSNQDAAFTYGNYTEYKTSIGEGIENFWNPSATIADSRTQYVLEVPHEIKMTNNRSVYNNYTTATLFSDVLTAKNHMDSEYKMQVDDEKGTYILDRFRQYTGIDSCSNTISLYYDADMVAKADLEKDNASENLAQEYSVFDDAGKSTSPHSTELKYKRIETIKAINRFQHDMKHKSNLFSVRVKNSMVNEMDREAAGAVEAASALKEEDGRESELEKALRNQQKVNEDTKNVRLLISNAIEKICRDYAPAHNQLFKVYFE